MLTILSTKNSIINQYLRELRDIELQKDRPRFELNLERIGMITGYELSKQFQYTNHKTQTPLGVAETPILKDEIVISTILRAGLPLQKGIHTILSSASLAFIAAGRKPDTSSGVEIDLAYIATPDLRDKVLIIADTMLATGRSIVDTYDALNKYGSPNQVFVVSVIATQAGIDYVSKHLPKAKLLVAAVDQELNDEYFIVPGLGDAGDLLYGQKL